MNYENLKNMQKIQEYVTNMRPAFNKRAVFSDETESYRMPFEPKTGDISNVIYKPCKCGRTFARMEKIKGRSDDMLKIRGVNVFPSQIESVLVGMKNVSPHYQLIVRREGFADTLEVQVELSDNSLLESFGMIQDLQNSIKHNLHTVLGILSS